MAKTILVVDDIPFVRKTIKDILTHAHFQVVGEASTGAEAVEQYIKLKPDLVTMDLVMPVMSGVDATRKILAINREAKIVIITAMGQESLVMETINAGAKDFVLKPFTAEELVKTIERAMANHIITTSRMTIVAK